MATAFDVAQYIVDRQGPVTSMKLQKLVYYSQAWSTVWNDDVLFNERIEAWDNGPVVRPLWEANRGQFRVAQVPGADVSNISASQADVIDRVLEFYGDKDAQWLSDLTHLEDPWKDAFGVGKNTEITPEALSKYYGAIRSPENEAA